MIIGIDGNEANVDSHVGVSVYTLNLLTYFQKNSNDSVRFNIYLKNKPKNFLPEQTKNFRYITVPGPIAWSQIFLPLYLNTHRPDDIFLSPAHYSPRSLRSPLIVTIHDLSYFYYPDEFLKKDLYKLTNWTKDSITKAKKIIAVSKTTKKDILKFYNVPEEKVSVIYNGYEKRDTDENKKDNTSIDLSDLKNYILYVGTIQPRKNLTTLIEAFAKFHTEQPDYKLVIVGRKGWLYEKIFTKVKEMNVEDSVIFTGYLPDSTVKKLYKDAFCFVLPSLYEGFGLPVLEAMSMGCPVIASFSSSLPEIGGEACLYFDPKNPAELTDKMNMLIQSAELRADLIQKGKQRVKEFSWQKCAEQTLDLIINTQKS
jgi:glycosyltransferase involved in cell wall biosynthesis